MLSAASTKKKSVDDDTGMKSWNREIYIHTYIYISTLLEYSSLFVFFSFLFLPLLCESSGFESDARC